MHKTTGAQLQLQETKLELISAEDICETLGARFSKQFACLPAQGTRGGAVLDLTDRLGVD